MWYINPVESILEHFPVKLATKALLIHGVHQGPVFKPLTF